MSAKEKAKLTQFILTTDSKDADGIKRNWIECKIFQELFIIGMNFNPANPKDARATVAHTRIDYGLLAKVVAELAAIYPEFSNQLYMKLTAPIFKSGGPKP